MTRPRKALTPNARVCLTTYGLYSQYPADPSRPYYDGWIPGRSGQIYLNWPTEIPAVLSALGSMLAGYRPTQARMREAMVEAFGRGVLCDHFDGGRRRAPKIPPGRDYLVIFPHTGEVTAENSYATRLSPGLLDAENRDGGGRGFCLPNLCGFVGDFTRLVPLALILDAGADHDLIFDVQALASL